MDWCYDWQRRATAHNDRCIRHKIIVNRRKLSKLNPSMSLILLFLNQQSHGELMKLSYLVTLPEKGVMSTNSIEPNDWNMLPHIEKRVQTFGIILFG